MMYKTLFTAILVINQIFLPSPIKLTGTVFNYNKAETWSGCTINIVDTYNSVTSDIKGEFELQFEINEASVDLEVSFSDITATTRVINIPIDKHEIKLARIPVFSNKSIEVEEFRKLSSKEQKRYKPIYHWDQLLGYIHKNKIDIPALGSKKLPVFNYDTKTNTMIFEYRDLPDVE